MPTIHRYVLVDDNAVAQDTEYDTLDEARQAAEEQGCAVFERDYTLTAWRLAPPGERS